jgi:hypothetical protein
MSMMKMEIPRLLFHHPVVNRMNVMANDVLLNAKANELKSPIRLPVTVALGQKFLLHNCYYGYWGYSATEVLISSIFGAIGMRKQKERRVKEVT